MRTRALLLIFLLGSSLFFFSQNLFSAEGREILRNGGFNDPAGEYTYWSLRAGGMGKFSTIPPDNPLDNKVLQVDVRQTSAKPWAMELLQLLSNDVEKGTTLYISFDYKLSEGYCFHFYWQVEQAPWPKLLSLKITEPADTWRTIQVAVPIHEDYFAERTAFSFHFAEEKGVLQLRNLSAKLFPPEINPEDLQTNVSPVLGGDFYDNDWRDHILKKVTTNRQSPVQLEILQNNKALKDCTINLKQLTSSIKIGVEASAALLNPAILRRRELAALRKKMSGKTELLIKYKEKTLANPRFDLISFYDGFQWREHKSWGNQIDKKLIEEALSFDKEIRGHALFTPAYMFAPPECRSMDRDKLREAVLQHIAALSKRHDPKALSWEVIHAAIEYNEIYEFIGIESILEIFETARKNFPGGKLFISDLNSLGEISENSLNDFIEFLDWLKAEEIIPDGLVLGVNLKRLDVAPQSMEKRLDKLSRSTKLPIHIRNLAVNEEDPEVQAAMLRDYLLLFFACKDVESVSFAELWEELLLIPNMAIFDRKLEAKEAVNVIQKLLTEDWNSSQILELDEEGIVQADLFLGDYELEILKGDKQYTEKFTVKKAAKAVNISLNLNDEFEKIPPQKVD